MEEGGVAQNDTAEAKLQQPTTSGSEDSDDDGTVRLHLVSAHLWDLGSFSLCFLPGASLVISLCDLKRLCQTA